MGACLLGLALFSFFRLWYMGTPNLDGLPLDMRWEILKRAVFFPLMGGLGYSYWKLLEADVGEGELNRLFIYSLILQVIAAFTLPLTSNDIFSNLAYGEMSHLGLNSHVLGVAALPPDSPFRQMVTARWMDMPMVYGPVIGWLNHLVVRPDSFWQSIILYKFHALILSAAITALFYFYCRTSLSGGERCNTFILTALNPVFIWELASQAHNDSVMIIGLAAFVIFIAKGMNWAALVCLLFAFVAKLAVLPVLGLFLCYTFFNSKRRFVFFCLVLGAGIVLSAHLFSDKLSMILVAPSSRGIDAARLTNSPLFLIYKYLAPYGAVVQTAAYKIYWISSMLLMAFLGLRFAWRSRTIEDLFLHSFLFILLFNFIVTPSYQPWYLTWLIPFIMVLKDPRLRSFFVIYSFVSLLIGIISNSTIDSVVNICTLGVFWQMYLRKRARENF